MEAETPGLEPEGSAKQTRVRLSKRQWAAIRVRYETSDNMEVVAKEYGISRTAIFNRAKREGWGERGGITSKAAEEAQAAIKDSIIEDHLEAVKKATKNHQQLFAYIQRIGAGILKDLNDGKSVGRRPYELQAVTNAIKTSVDGMSAVLRMDDVNPFDDINDDPIRILSETWAREREELEAMANEGGGQIPTSVSQGNQAA